MNAVLDREARDLAVWKAGGDPGGFATLLGATPRSVRLERVHFPAKRPVQLAFVATMSSGLKVPVLAEHCPDDPSGHAAQVSTSLRKSRNGQRAGLALTPIVADPETCLVLRRPGLDERLPGLKLLYDARIAKACLSRLLGTAPGSVRMHSLAHRLGKRAVIRIDTDDRPLFARLRAVKSEDGAERLARHRAIWRALFDGARLKIPEPLGALPEHGMSLFGELPGRPPDFVRDGDAIAMALSTMQNLDLDGLPMHLGADEAGILRDWLERCRRYIPDLAEAITTAVETTCAELSASGGALRPCHRDLHEKQIHLANGVAGFLDFDTLSLADPALDPGNLLAHLFLAGQDERPLRRMLDGPGVDLWRRAALLRLAMIYAFTSTPDAGIRRLARGATR